MAPMRWSAEPDINSSVWPQLQVTQMVEPRPASPQAHVTDAVEFDSYVRSQSAA
jgi:hypothetical protein